MAIYDIRHRVAMNFTRAVPVCIDMAAHWTSARKVPAWIR